MQKTNMRHVLWVFSVAMMLTVSMLAQDRPSTLAPAPRRVTMTELKNVGKLEGQLVQLSALVRHTDTAQVFTFGDKEGPEIHVIIPNPATDAAHVGDSVDLTGFVRRFNASEFERDYRWFRRADYPDVKGGDWVIVATSVRTQEGTELVPSGTISSTPPNAPMTKPSKENTK
jgi:hypothetical protein